MEKRRDAFRRNEELENLLEDINAILGTVENDAIKSNLQEYPIVFLVGTLRSGSTVMMQWLANTTRFAYPTNMLSRFFKAPVLGAKIQLLLTDERYNFKNEILDFKGDIGFTSENGKTKGALSPNEFWYFWRSFLPFSDTDIRTDEELENCDLKDVFKQELLGIANVFEKPFALKSMICNYNIPFLNRLFPKALFIYTDREPSANIASALEARKRQSGDLKEWYSFKIPEYPDLIEIENPQRQVAGQVYYVKKAIEKGLGEVEDCRKLIVPYEEFCRNPRLFYNQIVEKLEEQGYALPSEYIGPEEFCATRSVADEKLLAYYESFK